MTFNEILNYAGSIGIFVFAIGYLVAQYKKGNNEGNVEVIKLLREQMEGLKLVVYENQQEVKRLSDEIIKLKTLGEEKDKKIKELTELLQNKDPRLQSFMKDTTDILTEIKNFMHNINQNFERK